MFRYLKLKNLSVLIITGIVFSCSPGESLESLTWQDLDGSPVLSPKEALRSFELEDGFIIELVASEPLIHDPITMEFDRDGNVWVIEMMGYMPNIEGTLENVPNGTIKMLEDTDGDGSMDKSTIVIDSLILPRAMKLIYGGILYAEPPNLWFTKLNNGIPSKKILVDSTYAIGGNVEHQPNGLLLGLDNWIYSAKSSKRYRKINGKWTIEPTEFRGQWGISQTVNGLLVYNTNSNQLRGDYIAPSNIIRNTSIRRSKTTNIEWVSDQKVYPIRPNTGINRGYSEGMLDSEGRLTSFTAACGPVIYTGHTFPTSFNGNGFVAEPAGNLIKRNIISYEGIRITGTQTGNREFLASHDERFRPVNLYTGPDGNLYVVDMYRGVIQHITYLTNYLKNEIKSRNLDGPIGLGRIYRIKPKDIGANDVKFGFQTNQQLVSALGHPNLWVRLTSQQILIERGTTILEPVKEMMRNSSNEFQLIHGIWVLEGIGEIDDFLFDYPESYSSTTITHLIRSTGKGILPKNYQQYIDTWRSLISLDDIRINLEVALAIGELLPYDTTSLYELANLILDQTSPNEIIEEALLSSMASLEKNIPVDLLSHKGFSKIVEESIVNEAPIISTPGRGSKGRYDSHCMSCHGADGQGIQSLGPPLANSEWVNGEKERLIAIVLVGLEGPVHVNNIYYKTPDIAPLMPGIRDTESLGNSNVVEIINYVRTHWGNNASTVEASDVQKIRLKYKDRKKPFTENELLTN